MVQALVVDERDDKRPEDKKGLLHAISDLYADLRLSACSNAIVHAVKTASSCDSAVLFLRIDGGFRCVAARIRGQSPGGVNLPTTPLEDSWPALLEMQEDHQPVTIADTAANPF